MGISQDYEGQAEEQDVGHEWEHNLPEYSLASELLTQLTTFNCSPILASFFSGHRVPEYCIRSAVPRLNANLSFGNPWVLNDLVTWPSGTLCLLKRIMSSKDIQEQRRSFTE